MSDSMTWRDISRKKMMGSWRNMIQKEMAKRGDSWQFTEYCTLSDEELDREFCSGYGSPEGEPFTLWTITRIYFPATYDGSEWVESIARHPSKEVTWHVGNW
jgi:hypothetical protein